MNIEKPPQDGCLLIAPGPDLSLSFAPGWPIRRLRAKGKIYERVRHYNTLTFFYDWLRNSSGQLIGVRFYPHDPRLLAKLASLRYVTTRRYPNVPQQAVDCEVQIYFGEDRELDPTISVDQDFLYSEHFETGSGDMLFALAPNDAFTEKEWEGMRRAQVRWEDFAVEYDESGEKIADGT
jgi:hypothetical protein